jgi:hypothetical protein
MGNIKTDLRKLGSEDERWMKLAHDHFQYRVLVFAKLNFSILPPET